jgi:ferredoxin
MRLRVDYNRCQGHTLCALAAPALVELREDDGHAAPVARDLVDDELPVAQAAVDACPERALSLGP